MPRSEQHRDKTAAILACAISRACDAEYDPVVPPSPFIEQMQYHGICGVLADKCADVLGEWPGEITSVVREQAIGQAMWEMRHQALLEEVFHAFSAVEISGVVLKGTAFAYSLYERPAQRFRGDTDLLVASQDLAEVREILEGLGLKRQFDTHGSWGDMHFQEIWQRVYPDKSLHDIDLHWRVTNSEFLERVLSAEEVMARAVPLPELHPAALMPDLVLCLLHACINRANHRSGGYFWIDGFRYDGDRLIWAYDIDLIISHLSQRDWTEFAELAGQRGVAAVCLDALRFAENRLGTCIPREVVDVLARAPAQTRELSYISSKDVFQKSLQDFRSQTGLRAKAGFILARAFPSRSFIRAKYPDHDRWPIWLLYTKRQAAALIKAWRT